ncbi:MAG: hypothetical protein WCH79_14410, partial [Planctomycetia bacterium]
MNVANGIRLLAAMALVTWATQPGFISALADDGAPGDDSALRWTPHRAAASPAAALANAPQPSAAPAAAARIDPALFPVASDAPPSPGADRPRMLPPRPL